MHPLFDLTGRSALVTGAASGIGRESATVLASLGATVFATDRNAEGLQSLVDALPNGAVALVHDVTRPRDWDAAIAEVSSRAGRLDVLVNNAGIMIKQGFLDTPLAEFQRLQSINLDSVVIGMQAALPLMLETSRQFAAHPSIINVSSIYGQIAGAAFSAYSASKGAVRALTRAVAVEYAAHRIRANTVHPGPVATNLSAGWAPMKDAQGNPVPPEQARAAIERLIPMGRMGKVDDIAGVVAFLACDASKYMTGSELVADGGYSAI